MITIDVGDKFDQIVAGAGQTDVYRHDKVEMRKRQAIVTLQSPTPASFFFLHLDILFLCKSIVTGNIVNQGCVQRIGAQGVAIIKY
jgi:hypothetical protein